MDAMRRGYIEQRLDEVEMTLWERVTIRRLVTLEITSAELLVRR